MYEPAATKTELLQAIADSGGGDPYRMVSAIVRGTYVTVDRWCNELLADGFVTGDADIPYVECTAKGRRLLSVYEKVLAGEEIIMVKADG